MELLRKREIELRDACLNNRTLLIRNYKDKIMLRMLQLAAAYIVSIKPYL